MWACRCPSRPGAAGAGQGNASFRAAAARAAPARPRPPLARSGRGPGLGRRGHQAQRPRPTPPSALWPPSFFRAPPSPVDAPSDSVDELEESERAALAAAVAAAGSRGGNPTPPPPPSASTPATTAAARAWWWATVGVAAATAVHTPLVLAFADFPAFYSGQDPGAWVEAALAAAWAVDAVAARAAAPEAGTTLDDAAVSAATLGSAAPATDRAATGWLDLAATVPFDFLAVAALGGPAAAAQAGALPYLALLRLASLLRLHRLRAGFAFLELNEQFDILAITILRNAALVLLGAHAVACGFAYLAHLPPGTLAPEALVGADAAYFAGLAPTGQYAYALWWGLTSLTAGAEFGNGSPATPAETTAAAARSALFLTFQVTLFSYIYGTTTLLLVRGDEETGRYRAQSARLRGFARANAVPPDLEAALGAHLRLRHASGEGGDEEAILAVYPAALRRRVLRHLYGRLLRASYLFAGTPATFRDALLADARLEIYLPGVDILGVGDAAGEVCLLVQGAAEARARWEGGGGGGGGDGAGVPPLPARVLAPGDLFGEVAFFTAQPQAEAVRSVSVCRVAVLPRGSLDSALRACPAGARTVLANLQSHAEGLVDLQFAGSGGGSGLASASPTPPTAVSPAQRAALGDLLAVRAAAASLAARFDEERTTQWLYAASRGAVPVLRQMLGEGADPDAGDFDGRCALHLAAGGGHAEAVSLLLAAGADPDRVDNFGLCALSEACTHAHDTIIDRLVAAGASLAVSRPARPPGARGAGASAASSREVADAARLCEAVYAGDAPLLRRYLRAGADPDAADYDARRPLHIAAAEGSLAMAAALVGGGRAAVNVEDRWGRTPLDEAERVGAQPVVDYLKGVGGRRGGGGRPGGTAPPRAASLVGE